MTPEQIDRLEAEALRQRRLVEASYLLHTSLDLDEVLSLILAAARDGVDAERGTVFLLRDGGELWSRVTSGEEQLEIRLPVGKGIAGTVAETGRPINIADAYADDRFDPTWDRQTGFRTKQILCAPIRRRDGAMAGVFQLLNKRSPGDGRVSFDDADEDFLAGLSIHAALALENSLLHASSLERERYDREVRLAQGVQRQLQPARCRVAVGGLNVAGLNDLCEDATGDYYDVLPDLPGGRLGVVIGDVSGHGLQAALLMSSARAYLCAFIRTATSLPGAIDLVNAALLPDLTAGRFLSLFAAVIDPATGHTEWCNAGHNPPLHRRAADGAIAALAATGPLLGVVDRIVYAPGEAVALAADDVLLLYTDGVTEARRPDGTMFGDERLRNVLAASAALEPDEILDTIRTAVTGWSAGPRLEDDLTAVVVKRG